MSQEIKFTKIYSEIQERLKDSILSLWATGDAQFQDYLTNLFEEEKLLAEPVFQNTFPWTPAKETFGDLSNLFDNKFISKLDKIKGEYEFPKNRNPYEHQIRSWNALLKEKKSIAVTTGTGSGKTECFMLPVLQDLYENCQDEPGIRAIFLYPLNALIGSQKKRMDAWVKALDGLTYAVYNGNTPDGNTPAKQRSEARPELIDRKDIRETPPQILFTNPSMLEYILVRDKDVSLLENSKGKLRWILLDEAHTLVGSAASEMALLIRRVIDAFEVDVKDLRFAITSATVGSGPESENSLKDFMANLCGIEKHQIEVITGKREFKELPDDFKIQSKTEIELLRKKVYNSDAITLSEITNSFITKDSSFDQKLKVVDSIVENKLNDISILPLRAHLFSRGIGGVYVCSNPNCDKHKNFEAKSLMGTMTTYAEKNCSHCNFPMFELIACRSCGNELLKAEKQIDKGYEFLKLSTSINQDNFIVDDIDNDEDENTCSPSQSFFFTKRNNSKRYVANTIDFGIDNNGKINRNQNEFIEADRDGECVCPHCSSNLENPLHFRISSSFMNRILSDVFLENTPGANELRTEMLWDGHKYISFTDSRQGTAKISALINIDNENNWIRSQIFHLICTEQLNTTLDRTFDSADLKELEEQLLLQKNPLLKKIIEESIDKIKATAQKSNAKVRLSWKQLYEFINPKSDLKTLFKNNNPREGNDVNIEKYSRALLFDNFARRLPRERSLENLGMVSLVYPDLDNVQLPKIAEQYNITNEEWKSLLKIGLDYIIRNQFYFFLDNSIYPYSTSFLKSFQIHDLDSNITNAKKWPAYSRNEVRPNRMSLLLCAGLGFHDRSEITKEIEEDINNLLMQIWRTIKARILTADDNGFKLNLEEKTRFQLPDKLWLCPVKRRLIDAQFRGFSPWISGSFTEDNIRHFEIKQTQPYSFPKFQFPFNRNEHNELDLEATKKWIVENSIGWKEKGLWNNIHEKTILNRPLYLSGEHSAQQNEKRLKQLEDKFEKAEINILNCSTTMEMGVDIGGISTVVMNNVPPGPANYLQRAGRAGRRKESKSLAFTVCTPNPIGLNAFSKPTWALTHKIAPPFISFNSTQVIERHINAFFLGKFVQTDEVKGIRVTDKIDSFFFDEVEPIAVKFNSWLLGNEAASFSNQVKSITKETSFADKSFNYILNKVFLNFNKILNKSKNKKEGFENKLKEMEAEFGKNSPAFKSINIQSIQFLNKNALSYLAQEGFLPTAGLPTGVVEFDIRNIDAINKKNSNSRENPSYFITRALTEFAPGNNIVIDGMNYRSSGIILDDNRGTQSSKEIIQLCNSCGYQRIVEVAEGQNIDTQCPHCNNNNFRGINFNDTDLRSNFTEMIQPAGFAVDIYQTANRKISESSKIQYVDPLLINVKPWEQNSNNIYDIRESEEDGEILYYNVGNGNGFHVCLHCGKTGLSLEELNDHRRLRGGKDDSGNTACSGNSSPSAIKSNVILGGRFKTDFCEIRIREKTAYSKNETLLYSLGSTFVKELASYLAIEANELDFGIKRYDNYYTIFIFDTTKGGAGYANQFFLYADEIFKQSLNKLECECQNACTKCLIDRKTQWHINLLDRNIVLDWLKTINDFKIPEDIINIYPLAKRMLGGIKQELVKLNYASKIKEIWLFVNPAIQNWDLDGKLFLENLKNKTKINIVLNGNPIIANNQELMTVIQLAAWSSLWVNKSTDKTLFKAISLAQLQDGSIYSYFVNDQVILDLNKNWGETNNGELYKINLQALPNLEKIETDKLLNSGNVFEIYLDTVLKIQSVNLADEVLAKLKSKVDLKAKMNGKKFNISYSDRYLKTPFGCLLMLQFLDRLQVVLNFEIENFTFYGQKFYNERTPYKIFHEFKDSESRDSYIKSIAYELNLDTVNVLSDSIPHYRYFELSNDENKIIIRPDAGVEHGWNLKDSNARVEDANSLDIQFEILKMNNHPILYTISIENN
ncbi:DEAD/DEAH box helicase [Flavobacterium sp. M31R6]|uniref:DEAD/DEAH box helicase n=1 Tax=Flavobacterium sp. M31R6 TaxID=2739062 RepID=UPI001569BF1F|nr:DEAD/DEAH box helicase [Flavobacterium sp. M31R6]QKJ63328.1 DEAD/DEAH box helicase [Flavobacterium sp. M31R6]